MHRLLEIIDQRKDSHVLAVAFVILVTIGFCDFVTGFELSLTVIYLVPIFLAAWKGGLIWGTVFSFLSFCSILIVGFATGHNFSSDFYFYFISLSRCAQFFIVMLLLVAVRKSFQKEITLAHTDALTGLENRLSFYEFVSREIERQRRYLHPFALIYIDCDNFKQINDQLGHNTGDDLLRLLGVTARNNLRLTDRVYRLGGDEFAIFLPETDETACQTVMEKLKRQLNQSMIDHDWPVTFSMGAAVFLNAPLDLDHALETADQLLYEAKNQGKDRLVIRSFT